MEYKRFDTLYWIIAFIISTITLIIKYFYDKDAKTDTIVWLTIIVLVSGSIVAYKVNKWLKEPD